MPTVTMVRKEWSDDRSHQHIEGVCTADRTHYTRRQVVDGINRDEDWHTYANGQRAQIRRLTYCPGTGCLATPYITTRPDSSRDNNLENLPEC